MVGGYLRTNFRRGGGIPITALGGGHNIGSWAGGAGTTKLYGGMIWGSTSGCASVCNISAYDAMQSFYGDGVFDSGYRFMCLGVHQRRNTPQSEKAAGVVWQSWSGSITELYFPEQAISAASTADAAVAIYGTTVSYAITYYGFITSSP